MIEIDTAFNIGDMVTPLDGEGRYQSEPVKITAVYPPGHPEHPGGDVTFFGIEGTNTAYPEDRLMAADDESTPDEPAPGRPRTFLKDDIGLGERLAHRHGDKLKHCDEWSSWLAWDGRRWVRDSTKQAHRLAKETARAMLVEAANCLDPDLQEGLAKWAAKSQSNYRVGVMMQMAKSELSIAVHPDDFDQDRLKLNCLNGTLDLETGELLPHDQHNMITKLAPVNYDPGAKCPRWDEFLGEILNHNADLIGFLRRAVGYSLTGSTSEQCLFILHGTGANGKSTFLEVIRGMLGDYARQTPVDTLMLKRVGGGSDPSPDLARLKGVHLVTATEAEQGRRLAESLVKQLTGGDTISARFLYSKFFEYTPAFKIWLSTNHKPIIRGTDHAIWRRLRLVPFTVTIPEPEQDRDLADKLLAELPGILAWAARGCRDWLQDGLGTPQEVKDATSAYRGEMDRLGAFLEECCIEHESSRARAGLLYKAYRLWCEENGERPLGSRNFSLRLTERGFTKGHDMHGNYYAGLGLLAAADPDTSIPL